MRAIFEPISLEQALPRSSHTLSVVGSSAYLFGGEVRPREPVDNVVDAFSAKRASTEERITLKAYESSASAPPPRVGHGAAVVGHDVYIFGGRGGKDTKPLEERGRVWKLSTSTSKWSALDTTSEKYPEARSYHSVAGASDLGQLFVHAGCPASGRQSDLWSFSTADCEWEKLADAPLPARGGPGFAYGLGKLYRYGGFDGTNELVGQLDYIDVSKSAASASWKSKTYQQDQAPGPRSVMGLEVVQSKGKSHLVAFLGEKDASKIGHDGSGVFWGDVWTLALDEAGEPTEKRWSRCEVIGSTPERGWFASDVLDGEKIVLHGGLNARNERESDVFVISFQ